MCDRTTIAHTTHHHRRQTGTASETLVSDSLHWGGSFNSMPAASDRPDTATAGSACTVGVEVGGWSVRAQGKQKKKNDRGNGSLDELFVIN